MTCTRRDGLTDEHIEECHECREAHLEVLRGAFQSGVDTVDGAE
jgi:hypothetical protein